MATAYDDDTITAMLKVLKSELDDATYAKVRAVLTGQPGEAQDDLEPTDGSLTPAERQELTGMDRLPAGMRQGARDRFFAKRAARSDVAKSFADRFPEAARITSV